MEENKFFKALRRDMIIVNRLCHILSGDEAEIMNHSVRVGRIAKALLEKIGKTNSEFKASETDKEYIALSDNFESRLKNKPEKYVIGESAEDERLINLYSLCAAKLLSGYFAYVSDGVKSYYDSGFSVQPKNKVLFDAQIPSDTELISAAQCYDAMTSYIPYFPKRTPEQACKAIATGSCGAFSQTLCGALNDIQKELPMETNFSKKVLIVDDQKVSRVILSNMFKDDFGILEAGDAESGMEMLKRYRNEIILVIVDYRLSGTRNLDFLRRFRDDSSNDGLPIAVGTLITNDDDVSRCYELGADDLIYKPFERNEVRRRMLNLVELYEYKARR